MANRHGMPIWYELLTPDPDAAQGFYGQVLGWVFHRPPGGLMRDYRIAQAGDEGVAGIMVPPEGAQIPPGWLVYFGVDDTDAAQKLAEGEGGSVRMGATDIPGVGRFAFLSDPQGGPFYVMRGAGDEDSRAFQSGGQAPQGHAVWNELTSSDPDAALRFYGKLLGLRQEGAMPMGDEGDYRFVHIGSDCIGAVMGTGSGMSAAWQVYFSVDDIDAALARMNEAGGRSLWGPDEVPGGSFAIVAEDLAGARFGLVGPRRS